MTDINGNKIGFGRASLRFFLKFVSGTFFDFHLLHLD
ncbi:MAG: hypothetical protein ACFFDN_03505 [Candidatus Hodarchaeota archaeon]